MRQAGWQDQERHVSKVSQGPAWRLWSPARMPVIDHANGYEYGD